MSWDIPRRFCGIKLYMGKNREYKYQKDISKWLNSGYGGNVRIVFQTKPGLITTEAVITIYNLTKTQIERLAITSNMWSNGNVSYDNLIELYAGYTTEEPKTQKIDWSNTQLIFSGNIIEAKPNLNSSNFYITLIAQSRFNDIQKQSGDTLIDLPGEQNVETILNAIANKFSWVDKGGRLAKYKVNVAPECKKLTKKDYNKVGNLREHLEFCNVEWEPYGHCFILSPENMIIWCDSLIHSTESGKPFWVDYRTNLIGTIQPNERGFECDIILSPQISRRNYICLNNVSFPRLNTDKKTNDKIYTLLEFSHSGDTFGSDWRTHLVCVRQDLYKGNYTGEK